MIVLRRNDTLAAEQKKEDEGETKRIEEEKNKTKEQGAPQPNAPPPGELPPNVRTDFE